jgi:hypothetical protein
MKADPSRRRAHWWNSLFPGWPFWLGQGTADRLTEPQRSIQHLEVSQSKCRHINLLRRWDNADDMGSPEKVSRYLCDACGASFSREEGERLRHTSR